MNASANRFVASPMTSLIPYGLSKIWGHPANRHAGGVSAVARCFLRSGSWGSYQLKKKLGLFSPQGRVISWVDGLQVRLLGSSQQSQACFYYGLYDWPSMQFLRRFVRHGDLCADIGANVGTYSLLLAEGITIKSLLPLRRPTCLHPM